MIASLRGTVLAIHSFIIIEVAGVGYKVQVPSSILGSVTIGEETYIHTYQYIREDASDLYGFRSPAELEIFEDLISVSGIGPKAGLALLSQFSVQQLQESIVMGDTTLLTKVSGIGKKTAERLILELKETFSDRVQGTVFQGGSSDVVAIALEQLGYSSQEVLQALKNIDRAQSESDQIKAALAQLSSGR
jgi:Holliday junction DNA helicase RuvA